MMEHAGPLLLKQTEDHPSPIRTNCNRLEEIASLPHLGDEILRGDVYRHFREDFWRWCAFQGLHFTSDEKGDLNNPFLYQTNSNQSSCACMTWSLLDFELRCNCIMWQLRVRFSMLWWIWCYSMIVWNWNKVTSYISALKPLPMLPNSSKWP